MLKGRILLVVALYIILGVIAFFNFGFYHYLTDKVEWKSLGNNSAGKNFDESIDDTQTEVTQESQGSALDKEMNNSDK
jgi:hypothetical protein